MSTEICRRFGAAGKDVDGLANPPSFSLWVYIRRNDHCQASVPIQHMSLTGLVFNVKIFFLDPMRNATKNES